MGNLIFNYTESVYKAKINELNRLIARMKTHVDRLEELRDDLEKYWDDDTAREYYNVISTQIRAVRNALNRTISLSDFYKSSQDEITNKQTLSGEALEDVSAIIKSLGIG